MIFDCRAVPCAPGGVPLGEAWEFEIEADTQEEAHRLAVDLVRQRWG